MNWRDGRPSIRCRGDWARARFELFVVPREKNSNTAPFKKTTTEQHGGGRTSCTNQPLWLTTLHAGKQSTINIIRISHLLKNRNMTRQLMYGRSHRGKLDRGFEELQLIMSGSGTSKATSRPIQTKTDSMFESTKHLLTTASRLKSAAKFWRNASKYLVTISLVDLRFLKGHNI